MPSCVDVARACRTWSSHTTGPAGTLGTLSANPFPPPDPRDTALGPGLEGCGLRELRAVSLAPGDWSWRGVSGLVGVSRTCQARLSGPAPWASQAGSQLPRPLQTFLLPGKSPFFLFSLLLLLVSAFLHLTLKFGRKRVCLRTFQSQDPGRVVREPGVGGRGELLAAETCLLPAVLASRALSSQGCVPHEERHGSLWAYNPRARVTTRPCWWPHPRGGTGVISTSRILQGITTFTGVIRQTQV